MLFEELFVGRYLKFVNEMLSTFNSLDFIKGICMKFSFPVLKSRKLPCLNGQESKVEMLILCGHVLWHLSNYVLERDVMLDM